MSLVIKPQLNGTRPPQTPTRPSLMGPPLTPASRIPRKTQGLSQGPNEGSDHSELGQSTRSKSGSAHKPTAIKSVILKARLVSTPGKNIGSVDQNKNKSKASSCKQKPQQQPPQPPESFGSQKVVLTSFLQDEKKEQNIKQLKQLLTESNHRFQGIVIVIQQVLDQHDKASRKCREVSQELVKLRGKLESVEEEKGELRAALHNATQSLQEQHQEDVAEPQAKLQEKHLKDVTELEQSLLARYQAEWDKLHLTFQQEADSCRAILQKQMTELKANHEITKLELNHEQQHELQRHEQQRHEQKHEEVRRVHGEELQCFSQRAETSLCKDSYTLYLEKELESLKVVLDLKTKQLCQQEKNLMEISELRERNLMLEENIKKIQQENEDLAVRVEKHAAMSRQLSTEHAVLQESLHKESKVIERLSLENEELLWKLQNGVS
ncbi:microtubule-associated tumor suppressor 1 homolog A [Nematolebias whitei]|uniref:microtubule-associated tumor suppressor 1 homolog A n=1 Tax=Nematolebias whitei TaxID=451745 RepID=UPI001897AE3E|nr:microtubule-associated tumor suppressor 1 homolog A [Nematolebias whitei]